MAKAITALLTKVPEKDEEELSIKVRLWVPLKAFSVQVTTPLALLHPSEQLAKVAWLGLKVSTTTASTCVNRSFSAQSGVAVNRNFGQQ